MKTYIAFLRGINVGGNNILPMKELRALLSGIGLSSVQTYIQSGNVVFQAEVGNQDALGQLIQKAIYNRYGFSPKTFVLGVEDLQSAIANNPFSAHADDPKATQFYFLESVPESVGIASARELAAESELCALVGQVFYLHAPNGIGRSKLAAGVEKALGVAATARNLRSATKVLEMATAITG